MKLINMKTLCYIYYKYVYVYIHISYSCLSHVKIQCTCIEWICCIDFFTKRNECHFDRNARQVEHGWRRYNSPNFWIFGWITRSLTTLLKPPFVEHILPFSCWISTMSVCFWSFVTLLGITLQEINISHLGKRKIIFKMDFSGDMLVPRKLNPEVTQFSVIIGPGAIFCISSCVPTIDAIAGCGVSNLSNWASWRPSLEHGGKQRTWMVTVDGSEIPNNHLGWLKTRSK